MAGSVENPGRETSHNSTHALQGACPIVPSSRGEGGPTRCEAAGLEKPEAYSMEYVEDFFGPRTTQMVADRSQ